MLLLLSSGSHKANFKWPVGRSTSLSAMSAEMAGLFVELGGKAGTAVLFTHDVVHASRIEAPGYCRHVIHTAYNFGLFSRGWLADHTDYEALHQKLPIGSWARYLVRRPDYIDHDRPPDEYHEGRISQLARL